MLSNVKVPVLLTHHFRMLDEQTGGVRGALADVQATRVRELITQAGQTAGICLAADDGALAARTGPGIVREGVDGVGGEARMTAGTAYCLPETTTSIRCGPRFAIASLTARRNAAGSSMRSAVIPMPRANAVKSSVGDRSMCG